MLSEAELLTVATMLPTEIKVDSSFINDVQFISAPLPKIDVEIFNGIFTSIRNKNSSIRISFY